MNRKPQSTFARLIGDVFRLKLLLMRSRQDDNSAKHYKINYFIDPAILELYTEPQIWAPSIAPLPSLLGIEPSPRSRDNPHNRNDLLAAGALLTGEYIFSRHLTGDGNDLYVSPEHMEDFVAFLNKVVDRYDHTRAKVDATDERAEGILYGRLNHELNSMHVVRQGTKPNAEMEAQWLTRTRDIVLKHLAEAAYSDLLSLHRLQELTRLDVLASASTHPLFTHDIIAPSFENVQWWSKRILANKSGSFQKSPRALEADAVTLEQLYQLNKVRKETGNTFLLITDDDALFRSYIDRIRQDVGTFMPLRRPTQYIPVLNIKDMGGEFQTDRIFKELETAISNLVTVLSSNDSEAGFPDYIAEAAFIQDEITKLDRRPDASETTVEEYVADVSRLWTQLLKYACTSKADIIRKAVDRENEYLREFFRSRQFRDDFEGTAGSLRDSFSRLEAPYALLRSEIWALEWAGRDNSPDTGPRRDYAPRALPTQFSLSSSPALKGTTLNDVVVALHKDGLKALGQVMSITDLSERMLVMSGLCIDIGAWAAAANLIDRGRQHLKTQKPQNPQLVREFGFFHCMTTRLSASKDDWSRPTYRAIEPELQRLLDTAGHNTFDRDRIYFELIAVNLCAVAWSYNANGINSETRKHLDRVLELLDGAPTPAYTAVTDDVQAAPGWRIQRQLLLNILDATFWAKVVLTTVPAKLTARATQSLSLIDSNSAAFGPSAHLSLYPNMARLALGVASEDAIRMREDTQKTIDTLLREDRKAGFALDLPSVDKVEFALISTRLKDGFGLHP